MIALPGKLEIQAPAELEGVIRNAKDQGTQALYVWPSGFTFSFAKQISDIANAHGLPPWPARRRIPGGSRCGHPGTGVDPLPHLRILKEILCCHRSTHHTVLS